MKCAKTLLIFLFSHLPNVRQRSEARGLFLLHILNLPILHLHAVQLFFSTSDRHTQLVPFSCMHVKACAVLPLR